MLDEDTFLEDFSNRTPTPINGLNTDEVNVGTTVKQPHPGGLADNTLESPHAHHFPVKDVRFAF